MFQRLIAVPFTVAVALLVGMMLPAVLPHVGGFFANLYDDTFPVLVMSGSVVASDGDSVTVRISGEKLRGDECKFLSITGVTLDASGVKTQANITRIDVPQNGNTKDRGKWDIGLWKIQPVTDAAVSVQAYTNHSCLGRIINTKIVDVKLVKRASGNAQFIGD